MHPQTVPIAIARLQIALHRSFVALTALQSRFKKAISMAGDRVTDGRKAGFDPLMLTHVTGGTPAHMRRAQG